MDMKEYYEIAQEQLLEEKVEEFINQGMEEGKAQEKAEAEIENGGDDIYDRAVDMYSCHTDAAFDRYRDSLMER